MCMHCPGWFSSSADDAQRRIILKKGGDAVHENDDPSTDGRDAHGGQASQRVSLDQPPPQVGEDIVWYTARDLFLEAFEGQITKGFEKYRTYLETFNTRNAYIDAIQEKVDDLLYTTQVYMEARQMAELLADAVKLMHRVTLTGPHEGLERGLVESLRACKEKATLCLARSGLAGSTLDHTPT